MAKNNYTWVLLIAVVVLGYFLIAGNPFADKEKDAPVPPVTDVQCNKDFTTDVQLMSRNEYTKSEAVDTANTVIYKIWKMSGTDMIPQASQLEGSDLTVKYGEEFLVVATVNGTADVQFVEQKFAVDNKCNAPATKIFYMKAIPSAIDATLENSKITGPAAAGNLIPLPQDGTRTVKATFNGEAKTSMDAIIVFDADKDVISGIASDKASVSAPASHTAGVNEKSYAFNLGTFDQSKDVLANFDFTAKDSATIAEYNVSYTVYQYQTGYEHTKTGNWVTGKAITDNLDDNLLLTYAGTVWFDVTA